MRKPLLIITVLGLMTCLALAVSPSEKQQLDNFHVSTLKGLRGVAVSVKIVRPVKFEEFPGPKSSESRKLGIPEGDNPETLPLLKESQLAGEVEIALQKAGIEVLPPTPDVGLYIVLVNVAPAGREGLNIAMHVQSSLLQIVNLSRDPAIKTEAQTWPSLGQARFGVISIAIAKSTIERTIKDQADAFADDFKAANPKPSTAEPAENAEKK